MSDATYSETLVIERTFQAPATAVFDAFTHEDVLRRWWHARTAWTTPEASVDLRVGGALRVVMRDTDGDSHGGGGHYTAVERPHRLAFTWTWDRSEEARETLIEIAFVESDGATTVTFPSAATAGAGFRALIKRVGTSNVTLPFTLECPSGNSFYQLTSQYAYVELVSTGSAWTVLARSPSGVICTP